MKAVILSGGHGTRLRPLTHTGPKQLIPIANKPNILYCIEDVLGSGIRDIGIILGNIMPEKVIEFLGDGAMWGARITYIRQGEPKGIAHAVACAREFVGADSFVVYLGDNILKGGITHMVREFHTTKPDAAVALCPVKNPQAFGVAELDGEGRVVRLVEKPKEPKSNLALTGIYFFTTSIFDAIGRIRPSWRNELEITDAIDTLVQDGKRVTVFRVSGWWKDTGKVEDLLEANRLVLDDIQTSCRGTMEEGAVVKGRVSVGEGTVIAKGAVVNGPAVIGSRCSIGPGTYIGPYTAVGDGSRITGAHIEDTIIVGDARIECTARITESLIGRAATITSADGLLPEGTRLVIGENSQLRL